MARPVLRKVRVVAAVDRRGASAALRKLEARRDVDLELVSGAARAAASVWRRKAALVIFEVAAREDASPAAGAGAFDAVKALRAEASSANVPVLLLVPPGREDLRAQGFAAGASDVCFGPADRPFEEALLALAGIPLRRHPRRAASIALRSSVDGVAWNEATALNLSVGGAQVRWADDREIPAVGTVLRVEATLADGGAMALFAAVQGGTRAGGASLTRVRFVGLNDAERSRLEAAVAALPGPDEAEPEATPVPGEGPGADGGEEEGSAEAARAAAGGVPRYAIALGVFVALAAAGVAMQWVSGRPLNEPAMVSSPNPSP